MQPFILLISLMLMANLTNSCNPFYPIKRAITYELKNYIYKESLSFNLILQKINAKFFFLLLSTCLQIECIYVTEAVCIYPHLSRLCDCVKCFLLPPGQKDALPRPEREKTVEQGFSRLWVRFKGQKQQTNSGATLTIT